MNRGEYQAKAELQRGIARLGAAVRGAEDRAAVERSPRIECVSLLHYDAVAVLEALRRAEAYISGKEYIPLPPNPIFMAVATLDKLDESVKRLTGVVQDLESRAQAPE